ncbi:MAG: 23S rRNA pseudouridine1911/1915/1917 synthase [bacterium]|jgi:23S rRNA pseudouridine1911/1915/1917 synthase
MLNVLYLDNHLLVVQKASCMLVQPDHTGDLSLLDIGKEFLKEKFNKPGNVFLGLVHRLDRPVSGVIAFARTTKAASRLSEEFRLKTTKKIYWALVEGKVPKSGTWIDQIVRDEVNSYVFNDQIKRKFTQKPKHAELSFKLLDYKNGVSWVEIELETGRHHQIRVQFSSRKFPLLGDFRYGSKTQFGKKAVALHARSLEITHPTKKERIKFEAEPEKYWPKHFLP